MSNDTSMTKHDVNLTIDGLQVTVPEGTTILEAARKANVKIPTLCNHPDLCKRALCRICVVECDGRAKLAAACATEVWEGLSVVTNNPRLQGIRKTIIELILANHPQECLYCVRNKNCELQALAAVFGIRTSPFRREASYQGSLSNRPPETAAATLVRDMRKCIKCGRCVEVCQEIQTVRAVNASHRSVNYEICTPFGQALGDGPCILCFQCAEVCPVGAIYENDQSAEVQEALDKNDNEVIAQIAPSAAPAICVELGLPPGAVTTGMVVTAMKMMGFSHVFNASCFADMTISVESTELFNRIKTSDKLPMVSSCSPGWVKFVKEFYPDLLDHLSTVESPEQIFKTAINEYSIKKFNGKNKKKMFVTIIPCAAKKYGTTPADSEDSPDREIVLTARELIRMIRLTGIDLAALPETDFSFFDDDIMTYNYRTKNGPGNIWEAFWKIYKAYDFSTGPIDNTGKIEKPEDNGIEEAMLNLQGTKVKALVVNGLVNARAVMDSIRRGECDAALVGILHCPMESETTRQ